MNMFKTSKKTHTHIHTRTTCQIYFKLTIKTQERRLMLLLLTTHSALNSTVIIVEFDQINASLTWETIVSDNKFVFSNWEKYAVRWVGETCWATCFHSYSPNATLRKNKFSRQHHKKISRTLPPLLKLYCGTFV